MQADDTPAQQALYSANARSSSLCCSCLCAAGEPVAGLADAGRLARDNGNRPTSFGPNITENVRQAPMFSGSSCTQTAGTPSAYGARALPRSASDSGYSCSTRRMATSLHFCSARRAMAERGVAADQVQGSGPGNRVLKEDVDRHEAKRPDAVATPAPSSEPPAGREEDVVPLTLLRKRVAARLVESLQTTAQLTTFNEVDMSAVMTLRKQRGEAFKEKYGIKLGIMSFFVKAAIDALKTVPQINAYIRDENLVYRNYFDIGVAVSTDRGLVVPVIRDADRLSFAQVEVTLADLAARARDKKISPDELQGGTFTISNGGVFGSLLSTPILNPPQSGILGLHTIQDRPVVRDGQIVVRPMMYVALTYDHRVIDGRESVTFLSRVKECVEDPTRMLIEV